MKPLWIELVDSGVANRFDFGDYEVIEMNWRLTEEPDLYSRILNHELEHTSGNFKTKDLVHDMKSKTKGLHKFMFNNPSTWIQLLPAYFNIRHKQIVYDYSSIAMWLIGISSCALVYYGLGWLI